jgi:hypothetical protein
MNAAIRAGGGLGADVCGFAEIAALRMCRTVFDADVYAD